MEIFPANIILVKFWGHFLKNIDVQRRSGRFGKQNGKKW